MYSRGGGIHGAQINGQSTTPTGDYTNASVAEVRDAQGQIVLRGQFAVAEEEDDDIERKVALEQTGVDADAAGEAEVEFAKAAPTVQESNSPHEISSLALRSPSSSTDMTLPPQQPIDAETRKSSWKSDSRARLRRAELLAQECSTGSPESSGGSDTQVWLD